MDWRLNGRNAEQNYKIIIDKGAVRTGRAGGGESIPPRLARAGAAAQAPPPVCNLEKGVCCVCDLPARGSGPGVPTFGPDTR